MLVPIYLGLCQTADLDSTHKAASALINGNLRMAVLVSLAHSAAMESLHGQSTATSVSSSSREAGSISMPFGPSASFW